MPARPARSTQEAVDGAVARLAERQYGVISRSQATRIGATKAMVENRINSGRWLRLHPGVYRVAGAPPSWRGRLMAASLAYGCSVGISHRAASRLWALPHFDEELVELVVPRERGRIGGIVVHRVSSLEKVDLTTIGPIPVTTPARTLIDIAGICPVDVVEAALDDALRRRLVIIRSLRSRMQVLATNGRPGIRLLRRILSTRQGSAFPMSVFETKLLRLIRGAGLPLPVLQHEVRDGGRLVAVLDFAYPEALVAVEADGHRWHSGRAQWVRDLTRRNALTALGWRLVHVTWDDLTQRPDEVVATVARALALHRPR